jgi:tetratricopeptide (TPR) repeat protein
MARTCFVISPIGDEGTETRQLADDLLELIIVPALEPFDFDVIRADKIVSSGVITSEIIEYVQSADLCIIDLTGHNANVYYECGRRHETAKPFLQVIRKNETLPFDVSGIRTLSYDLTDARAVRVTVEEMRKYVQIVSSASGNTPRSAVSVTSLAESVDRLERKLDQLLTNAPMRLPGSADKQSPTEGVPSLFERRTPYEEFMGAVARGDQRGAEAALEILSAQRGIQDDAVRAAAALLAGAGSIKGATVLFGVLDWLFENTAATAEAADDSDGEATPYETKLIQTLTSLKDYYISADNSSEGYNRLLRPIEKALELISGQPEDAGRLCNALEMLAYAAKRFPDGVEWGKRAVEYCPTVTAYRTNLAMCYERLGRMAEAKELVDSALDLTPDDSHALSEAVDIYHALKDDTHVNELMGRLQQADQEQYLIKRFMLQRGL